MPEEEAPGPGLEDLVAELKRIIEEHGRLPSPSQAPEFYEILEEIHERFIQPRLTTWKELAEKLGVSESSLKSYFTNWKRGRTSQVGTLPHPLVRQVVNALVKHFKGKALDKLTAEYIDAIIQYGLIVKNNFEPHMLAKGRDPKVELAKALEMYKEWGDKLPEILDQNERLRKLVKVQQATIIELERLVKAFTDLTARAEVVG